MLENICNEYGFKLVNYRKGETGEMVFEFENKSVAEEYQIFCVEFDFTLEVVRIWFNFEMSSYSYAGEYSMNNEKEVIEAAKIYMEDTKEEE